MAGQLRGPKQELAFVSFYGAIDEEYYNLLGHYRHILRTFMLADSLHLGVESVMIRRSGGNVYDFPDFCDAIQKSNEGKVALVQMTDHDVRPCKNTQLAHQCWKLDVNTKLRNMITV